MKLSTPIANKTLESFSSTNPFSSKGKKTRNPRQVVSSGKHISISHIPKLSNIKDGITPFTPEARIRTTNTFSMHSLDGSDRNYRLVSPTKFSSEMVIKTDYEPLSTRRQWHRMSGNESVTSLKREIVTEFTPRAPNLMAYNNTDSISNLGNEPIEEEMKKISEQVKELKSEFNKYLNLDIGNAETSKFLHGTITMQALLLEKTYSKFALFPESEKTIIGTVIQAEKNLLKFVRAVHHLLEQSATAAEEVEDKNKKLQEYLEEARNKTGEIVRGVLSVNISKESKISAQLAEFTKKYNEDKMIWKVEKQKLTLQIEKMKETIDIYTREHPYFELKRAHDELIATANAKFKEYEAMLQKSEHRNFKLLTDFQAEKSSCDQIIAQNKILQQNYEEILAKFTGIQKKHDYHYEISHRYRENAFMAQEDIVERERKYQHLLDNYNNTRVRLYEMQDKLGKLAIEQGEAANFSHAVFEADNSLLRTIKDVFAKNKHPVIHTNIERLEDENQNLIWGALEGMNMSRFTFYRPTYLSFIEREYMEKKGGFKPLTTQTEKDFLSSVRGIFDSKCNEHMYNIDNTRLLTQFPDFVYGWLSAYTVDPVTLKVRMLDTKDNVDIEQRRLEFYNSLLDYKMSRVWDVVTFKEFLEEKCTLDEIYFYLQCRYLLFEGAQLNYISAGCNIIHFVKQERAERLVDIVLKKLEKEHLHRIKGSLKTKIKIKRNQGFLDSGFVLRVLLEIYRHDKKIKYVMLQETFLKMVPNALRKKVNLPFETYKTFMEMNYPFISETEKAQIYRESWCIGGGQVDFDSFFIAASESNFFIKALSIQYFQDVIPLIMDPSEGTYQELEEISAQAAHLYETMSVQFTDAKALAKDLGIEYLLVEIEEFGKTFSRKALQNTLKSEYLFIKLHQIAQIILRARAQNFTMNKLVLGRDQRLALLELKVIEKLVQTTEDHRRHGDNYMNKRLRLVVKMQDFCLAKLSKWYTTLGLVKKKLADAKKTVTENDQKGKKMTRGLTKKMTMKPQKTMTGGTN